MLFVMSKNFVCGLEILEISSFYVETNFFGKYVWVGCILTSHLSSVHIECKILEILAL